MARVDAGGLGQRFVRSAGLLRPPAAQGGQHGQRRCQMAGRAQRRGPGKPPVEMPFGDRCAEFGADQHRAPGDVHPDQEQRDRRNRAVDGLEGRKIRHIEDEPQLQNLEQHRRRDAAGQGVAPAHLPVRHDDVEKGETERRKHEGQKAHQCAEGPFESLDLQDLRNREDIARKRQAAADQQGGQGQDGPVGHQADGQPARHALAPDDVETLLDGAEQHQRGDRQKDDADSGELPGIGHEPGEVLAHDLAGGGNEIGEQELLHGFLHALEDGEGGEGGKADGGQRHDGQQRRVAERGGDGQAAVTAKAPAGMHRKPGKIARSGKIFAASAHRRRS